MSGHLRFCFAICVLFVAVSTAAASSNPFADFFGHATPTQPTTQAPAEENCLLRPGKSTASGQHWFYRFDGHRKCWFQAAEGTATSKQLVRHRGTKPAAARTESEAAQGERNAPAVADARAELPRFTPAQTTEPARAPEIKIVEAQAAALIPAAVPVIGDQDPTPPQVDVLLTAAPAATDAFGTQAPAVAVPITEVGENARWSRASWLGVLLMALGIVCLLSSRRTVRTAVLGWRETASPAIACEGTADIIQPRPSSGWRRAPASCIRVEPSRAGMSSGQRRT